VVVGDAQALALNGADPDHFSARPLKHRRVFVESELRRTGPGIAPVWHSHSAIELNLITAGRGVYFLDNGHYDLSPGVLVWLMPEQSHRLMPGPDLELWLITCAGDRCERDLLEDAARYPRRVLARDDAIALDRLFSHVSQDADEPRLYRSGIDYALRSACHVSVSGPDAPTPPLHPAVSTALRVLRDWPDVPSAAALAAKCRVSQDYLRELLVEQTGRGFVEWRNRSRLERFQILYPESGDLLTAALAAGFGSYTQFHRVFSDLVGVTPGEWVKGPTGVGAPPVTDFSPTPERASSRMIWYPLADVVIPQIGRLIGPGFAQALCEASDTPSPAIASGVTASYDLRRHEAGLMHSVAQHDPEGARLLEAALQRTDPIASFANSLHQWGFWLDDAAPCIAAHLAFAWAATNRKAAPGQDRMDRLRDQVRRALAANRSLADTSLEDRQAAIAAVSIQGYIVRSAAVAAVASGRHEIQDRVGASVRATTRATYGWDPAGADLPG
jgi:AraC-like DNA-binding protein